MRYPNEYVPSAAVVVVMGFPFPSRTASPVVASINDTTAPGIFGVVAANTALAVPESCDPQSVINGALIEKDCDPGAKVTVVPPESVVVASPRTVDVEPTN
ncbi:unannotated protein [freshwater metagenome]|uniref:Unannotated protein n=1 Tax=freshwater metagenome TaxID=449393 RepID=A0A6J7QQZ4_9ZZZZ